MRGKADDIGVPSIISVPFHVPLLRSLQKQNPFSDHAFPRVWKSQHRTGSNHHTGDKGIYNTVNRLYVNQIKRSTPVLKLTSIVHQHSQRNFRPRILRPWPLVALIFVTLSLIGFVEYAAIALPRGPSLLDKLGSDAKTFRHRLGNLTHGDTSSAPLVPRQPSASFSSSFPSIGGDILLSSSSTIYLGAPPSAFVPVTSSFGVTPTPSAEKVHTSFALNPSAFVPTGVSGGSSSVIAPGEPAPSAFVPVKRPVGSSSLVAPGEPAPSAYVPTTPPTTPQASDHPHSDAQARHFYPWWTGVDTFLGSYLATLIAALYRVVWTVVYCSFNLIEPLRALSQPDGASADLAFFSFYQSRSSFLGPIPALLGGRFALGLVAFTALLADLLPAFASESTVVNTNWNCPSPDVSNKHNPCPPRVEVDVGALRILQGLLAFAALVIFWLIYLQFVDKTYIPADPSSIAEIATLTRHPDLIDDFSCVPPDADTSEMKRMFRGRRYRLGFYRSSSGLDYYGIRPTTGGIRFDYRPLPDGSRSSRYPAANHSIHTTGVQTARPRRIWPIDIVLVILILGLFGLVLAYVLDSHYNDGFNTFFNSDTFGPRFILTLSGTAIAALWKSAEQCGYNLAF